MVTLIGVTKTIPPATIREAVALGLTEIGENRVQEAGIKKLALGSGLQARWHLIGHLQSNKAKAAVELFDVIHSVDSLKLIEELERHAATQERVMEVLVQVNVSGEATKSGCRPEDALPLANAIHGAAHLTLSGLMTIPPLANDPDAARVHFRRLRQLRDQLRGSGALKLSMGMSNDFEVAIEEGANFVRIGTAIFGERAA